MQIRKRRVTPDVAPVLGVNLPFAVPVIRPVTRKFPVRRGSANMPRFAPPVTVRWAHVQTATAHTSSGSPLTSLTTSVMPSVSVGDLLVASFSVFHGTYTPYTITDSTGLNTWSEGTLVGLTGVYVQYAWAVVQPGGGGNITVTCSTGGTADLIGLEVDEYSVSPGAKISIGTAVSATGSSTTPSTGNIAFGSFGSYLVLGLIGGDNTTSWTAATGFNVRGSHLGSGGYQSFIVQDKLNLAGASSPIACTATQGPTDPWAAIGVPFLAVQPVIFPSPLTIPANHAGNITISLTGTTTDWISGTTVFTATGSGVTLKSYAITSTTTASIVVTTGSATGYCVISDGTYTQNITVATASISIVPPGSGPSVNTTVAVTGVNTLWLSEPGSPPLFSTYGAGTSISNIVVGTNTSATFTLTSSATTGVAVITDVSTTAIAPAGFTVYPSAPGIAVSPGVLQVNQTSVTLTLTGTDTNWISGSTVFVLSGVAGVTFASPNITSTTAATIVVTTTTSFGVVTIFDGAYTGTFTVNAPALVGQSYVSRNGQTAYFHTNATNLNGIALTLTAGGSGYLSAPIVTISGGGGTFAAATAVINGSGVVTGLNLTNSGTAYTSAPTVLISGGGGSGATATAATALLTPSVVQTVLTAGGSGYTSPSASIPGGVALTLTFGGSGYTSAPSVSLTGGGGTGASATAAISSGIGVTLTAGGSGYQSNAVTFSGGGSTAAGAVAFALVNSSGVVSGLVVTNGGSGYSSAPTVAIGGSATATAIVSGNAVIGFTLTSGGSGYAVTAITGGNGSGAAASAIVNSAGVVTGLYLISGGRGYLGGIAPTVAITGGGGTLATATAYIPSGAVSGFTVTPGSGYTSVPALSISGGGGANATASVAIATNGGSGCVLGTPTMVSGVITSVPVVTPGSGYTSVPAVVITDSTGTGATATAILGGNPVGVTAVSANPTISVNGNPVMVPLYLNAITVTNGGGGYTSVPTVTITGGSGSGATAAFAPFADSITGGSVTNTYTLKNIVYPSIAITNPGWGYLAGDRLAVTFAGGGGGGGLQVTAVLGPVWTNFAYDWSFLPYQMLCGSVQSVIVQNGGSRYTTPVASATGGGGTGLVLGTPTLVNGVIASITITGLATKGNVVYVVDNDGTGSGFVGYYGSDGTNATGVFIESGGSNYSTNLTVKTSGSNGTSSGITYGTIAGGGIVIVNGVVASVPVTTAGSGYTSAPAITIADTDGGTGSGAVAVAFMSGPAPTDTVTWSAPVDWLTTSVGAVGASVSAPMMNFAGQLEPMFAQAPRALQLGTGAGSPNGSATGISKPQNWLKGTPTPWNGAAPPVVTITRGSGDTTGANATAYAVVGSTGTVTGIVVTCGGSAYTATPVITIAAPPSGTTAVIGGVTVSGDIITAISMSGGTAGTGYAGSTSDGHPIAINSATNFAGINTGYPNTFAQVCANDRGLTISPFTSEPGPAGLWTYTAVESNSSHPMTVSLYALGLSPELIPLVAGYPIVVGGGSTTWQWDVVPTGTETGFNLNLNVAGGSMGATAPWTHSSECMTAPLRGSGLAQTPNVAVPSTPNANFVSWLSPPKGVYPAFARLSPFGNNDNGASNVVDVGDLQVLSNFSYAGVGNAAIAQGNAFRATVIQIRPYIISSAGSPAYTSPYVWTSQNYPGTSAVGGGPAAYAWVPPNNVSSNNLNWLANTTGTSACAAELVTAQPHPFKTGQQITLNGIIEVVFDNANTSGTTTANIGGATSGGAIAYPAWVTGANTFVISSNAGLVPLGAGPTYAVSNVNPSNSATVYNFQATSSVPSGGYASPYEVLAGAVAAIPGCGLHTFIPCMATDATVTAIATAIRDNLPLGRLVIAEFCDEHWNTVYPSTIALGVMANLSTGTDFVQIYQGDDFFALRQAEIQQIFVNVFNETDINGNTNRGGSIIRAYGGFFDGSGVATNIATQANCYNALSPANPERVDRLMVAPYRDLPIDPLLVATGASTYSNYPGSIQYLSTAPWSIGMLVDLGRHDSLYNVSNPSHMNYNIAALAPYQLVPGQTAPPQIMCYEGSIEVSVPAGVSITDFSMRTMITVDVFYHPWFYDAITGYYLMLQEMGCMALQANELNYQFGQAGTTVTVQGNPDSINDAPWLYATCEPQTWGRGDGAADGNGNPTVNLFFNAAANPSGVGGQTWDMVNVSPKLQASRDWVTAANLRYGYYLPVSTSTRVPCRRLETLEPDERLTAWRTPSIEHWVTPSPRNLVSSYAESSPRSGRWPAQDPAFRGCPLQRGTETRYVCAVFGSYLVARIRPARSANEVSLARRPW